MAYKVIKGKNKIRGEQTFVDTISGSIISASYFVGDGSLLTGITVATSSFAINAATASVLAGFNQNNYLLTSSFNLFTASYNTGSFSGSFTGSLLGTASYTLNANLLDNRDSTTFAGTGSNTFYGNQIISGNNGYILQIHQTDDTPWGFAVFNDTNNQVQPSLGGFVWNDGRAAIGTEAEVPLEIYTNQNYYNPTLIISSSGVTINNTLSVSSGITGSLQGTASYALNADLFDNRDSTTFAGTGSNTFNGNQIITGALNVSSNISGASNLLIGGTSTLQNTTTTTLSGTTAQYTIVSASQIALTEYLDFNTAGTVPTYTQGRLFYNANTQDPAFYTSVTGVGINLGQQTAVKVKNSSGIAITKGKLVHIVGGAGANPLIATASWENDNNSANTLGMAMNDMNQNDFGFVLLNGVIEGIDTQGYTAGQIVYLSSSGDYTGTKPQAPLHAVKVGEIVRVQQNNGSMFVNIANGQEMEELHDVRVTSASAGDLLTYSSYNGTPLWVNTKTLSGSYVITGSLTISSSATFTNIGPAIFSGTINTNNTISGTTAQFTNLTASYISASSILINGSPISVDTGSLLTTSSVSNATITFTKGNGSTYPLTINNVVNAQTASYVLNAISASYASNADLLDNRDSTTFAGTGSNTFSNSQTINGNLFMSGNFRLVYNNDPTTNILFGQFDGGTIHGPYFQIFGNQYSNISQRGQAEIVYDNRNGGDSGFNVASFNGSTWTVRTRTTDNGLQVTGSLGVTNGITGSLFGTASYSSLAATASYVLNAVSSSYASNADLFDNRDSTTFANTSSNTFTGIQTFNQDITGTHAYFSGDVVINGTASIGMLETRNQQSLIVGDKYIVIMSGAVDHTTLDGSGILYGSGSTGPTTDENGANAYLRYRNAYDAVEAFPNFRVSGSLIVVSGSTFSTVSGTIAEFTQITGNLFGTSSFATNANNATTVTNGVYTNTNNTFTGINTFNTYYITGSITGSDAKFVSITGSFSGSGAGLVNIPNTALVNSSVTIGTTAISLGNSATTIQGISVLTGSIITGSTGLFTSTTTSTSTIGTALYATNTITTVVGNNVIYNVATASYDGMFVDYTARSGSNARAGQIMAIWSGSSVNYTETTTNDFGTTTGLAMAVVINGTNLQLSASASTANWTVKSIIRTI